MNKKVRGLVFVFMLIAVSAALASPVTQQLHFSQSTTLTVPATYTFRFSIWDVSSGGVEATNRIWWEEKGISMTTKTLTTNLGTVTDSSKRSGLLSDLDFSEQYWVQVEKKEPDGSYTPIGSRTKLTVVPYAMWSAQGGDVTSVTAGNGLTASSATGDITLNVGAGAGISVGADGVSIKTGGVASGMIATGAVTAGKLAANAVTATTIAEGAVTDAKITGPISASKISSTGLNADTVDSMHASDFAAAVHNHDAVYVNEGQAASISTGMIVDNAVTAAKIASGAVTDAKISGKISASKINSVGLNADTVDSKHAADFASSGDMQTLQETIASQQSTIAALQQTILALQQSVSALNTATPGAVSGWITNAVLGTAVAGVNVSATPGNKEYISSGTGRYGLQLTPGTYTITFTAPGFAAHSEQVTILPDTNTPLDISLNPDSGVIVDAGPDIVVTPGQTSQLNATISVLDGSTITGYEWKRLSDQTVVSTTASANVSLSYPNLSDLMGTSSAPFDAPLRHTAIGLTPAGLEKIKRSMDRVYQFTLTTTSGTYSDTVTVKAGDGPMQPTTGIKNVPLNVPVIFGAPSQGSYSWALTGPAGSNAALNSAIDRYATFTPDVGGTYTLSEATGSASLTVTARTWTGAVGDIQTNNCMICHEGTIAPDKFTPWNSSKHAGIFSSSVNSGYPSSDCLACHTLGYDVSAVNSGFDDAASGSGWSLPSQPSSQNYDAVPDSVKRMANVQCENCHGPLQSNHTSNTYSAEVFSSSVCGSCHGQAEGHGRYEQWQSSKHADLSLTLSAGTVETYGTSAAHCGRCHTAQGFVAWLSQGDLTKNIQGTGPNNSATLSDLTALGITNAAAHPVSCVTCHDPHSDANPSGLRLYDSTTTLPAGFSVAGMGKGAVCAACHNSRTGAHGDSLASTSYSAPHLSSEADILMGKNAYFMSNAAPTASHANIADTCVTCHMGNVSSPPSLSYQDAGKDHSFKASYSGCSVCHQGMSGESVSASIASQLVALSTYIGSKAKDMINSKISSDTLIYVRVWDPITDRYSSPNAVSPATPASNVALNAPIVSAVPVEIHGQISLLMTLPAPITIGLVDSNGNPAGTITTSEIWAQLGSIKKADSNLLYSTSGNMVKAGWNYLLLSNGNHNPAAHNPLWSQDVINRTMSQDLSL